MSSAEVFFLIFKILGGLVLFLFGMKLMTDGLRDAAGNHLRNFLKKATRNRMIGIALGTVLGTMVQSSASTVMYVGFVNAGLMELMPTIAPVLGANIGTTLSMQIISFHLADYCYFAMVVGFLVQLLAPRPFLKNAGTAFLGFGMLFLGMDTMSAAIGPYREQVVPWLAGIDGSTWQGMLYGVGVSLCATAIVQSSGATVGMCFALIAAGVFTRFEQVFPIVLGAQIGTCATALLGSIGTNIEARRVAAGHLLFNIIGAGIALAAAPLLFDLVPRTSSDLTHQTANLHTIVQVANALLFLPFIRPFTWLVRAVTPSRQAPPDPSFLDDGLLEKPEQALAAAIQELQRIAALCARSLRLTGQLIFAPDRRKLKAIKQSEAVINRIKLAMSDYLSNMTAKYLSRRQAVLIQHLGHCMVDIERIGDHIDALAELVMRQAKLPLARFDRETLELVLSLFQQADRVLELVIESLNPERTDFQAMARAILHARDAFVRQSESAREAFLERIAAHELPPLAGIYFSQFVSGLGRIVRHGKSIALAERQPDFWIKRSKLMRVAPDAPEVEPPPPPDPEDFLTQLHEEEYH